MPKGRIKNKTKRLTLRFERYPDIWEALVNNAHDNCRSLNNEVIYCMKEQYKFENDVKDWENKK